MKVLVAIDGSPNSDRVVLRAKTLVDQLGAEGQTLAFVRAVNLKDIALSIEDHESPDAFAARVVESIRQETESKISELVNGHKVTVLVEMGAAADLVNRTAQDSGADLLIIGAHSKGPLDRFFGRTAEQILRNAHCDVLVVR